MAEAKQSHLPDLRTTFVCPSTLRIVNDERDFESQSLQRLCPPSVACVMAMHKVDLGHLDLEHTLSGTQLHLNSLAQFAPSANDVIAFGQSLTLESLIPQYRSLWVKKGNNFRLVLGLRLVAGFLVSEQEDVAEKVASRLKEAEVSSDQLPSLRLD